MIRTAHSEYAPADQAWSAYEVGGDEETIGRGPTAEAAIADLHELMKVPVMSPQAGTLTVQSTSGAPTAHRGDTCELCGTSASPWPRAGKRRYPHKCPHGQWCVRGHRLLGWHQNHATCKECLALEKKS